MADPQQVLGARVRDALVAAYGADFAGTDPLIRPSSYADAQSNVALPLAKRLGKAPRDIAAEIVSHLDVAGVTEPPTVSGPGFVNFTLKDEWIARSVGEVLRCDPEVVDPYFLACFLRSEANRRRASGTIGGTARLDLRRARIPRVSMSEQRQYGEAFRRLTEVSDRIERVHALAGNAVQHAVYGLTSGALSPPRSTARDHGKAKG